MVDRESLLLWLSEENVTSDRLLRRVDARIADGHGVS